MRQWDNDQCWVSSSDITKLYLVHHYEGANCSPTVLKPFKVGKPLTPIVLKSWTVGNYWVAIFSCVIIIVNPHKKKKPSTIQRSTSVQRPSTLHWSLTSATLLMLSFFSVVISKLININRSELPNPSALFFLGQSHFWKHQQCHQQFWS